MVFLAQMYFDMLNPESSYNLYRHTDVQLSFVLCRRGPCQQLSLCCMNHCQACFVVTSPQQDYSHCLWQISDPALSHKHWTPLGKSTDNLRQAWLPPSWMDHARVGSASLLGRIWLAVARHARDSRGNRPKLVWFHGMFDLHLTSLRTQKLMEFAPEELNFFLHY